LQITHVEEDGEAYFTIKARISHALLRTVLSLRPVIRAFAITLCVNTQTVETQLSQVLCHFCRITCEPGFRLNFQ